MHAVTDTYRSISTAELAVAERVHEGISRRGGRRSARASSHRLEAVGALRNAGDQAFRTVLAVLLDSDDRRQVTLSRLLIRGLVGDAQALKLALLVLVVEYGEKRDQRALAHVRSLIAAVQAVQVAQAHVDEVTEARLHDDLNCSTLSSEGREPVRATAFGREPDVVVIKGVSEITIVSPANAPNVRIEALTILDSAA